MSSFSPEPYKSPIWLQSGHLQTLGGRFFRAGYSTEYHRERINTPDEDFLDLDFVGSVERVKNAPRGPVLILHGLEGCSQSSYVITTIEALTSAGFGCIAMNLRSCSGVPNRSPRFYHSGASGDLKFVLQYLNDTLKTDSIGVVGFSLGGNILLKYLGESGADAYCNYAATVSVPYDLAAGSKYLHHGFSKIYEKYFLIKLKLKMLNKERTHAHGLDLSNLVNVTSLEEFDDTYTAPLHQFKSAQDYYQQSSSYRYLDNIEKPTLIIHSKDDPFVPEESIPLGKIRTNSNLTGALTDRGGHVGFLKGPPWDISFWAEETLKDFLLSKTDK